MSSRCQNKQGGALTHAEAARVVLHTSSSIRTGKTLARSSACGAVQAGIFFTVGPGVSPGQRTRFKRPVADFTASGEFHPALKTSYPVVCKHYTTDGGKMQPPIFRGVAINFASVGRDDPGAPLPEGARPPWTAGRGRPALQRTPVPPAGDKAPSGRELSAAG